MAEVCTSPWIFLVESIEIIKLLLFLSTGTYNTFRMTEVMGELFGNGIVFAKFADGFVSGRSRGRVSLLGLGSIH